MLALSAWSNAALAAGMTLKRHKYWLVGFFAIMLLWTGVAIVAIFSHRALRALPDHWALALRSRLAIAAAGFR